MVSRLKGSPAFRATAARVFIDALLGRMDGTE
jgi:hypothetical protein